MTDAEKLQLIQRIAKTGFELCSGAEQRSFFYGILRAIDDVAGYDFKQKETPRVATHGK